VIENAAKNVKLKRRLGGDLINEGFYPFTYAFTVQNPVVYASNLCCRHCDRFFILLSYQNQSKAIGQAATVIQVIAIIGAGVVMWKVITECYMENFLNTMVFS
jgi:hypothetical protein